MNTTENNILIAEFMGWKVQKDPTERFFGRLKHIDGAWYKENEIAYNWSWDWLMPVVEKCLEGEAEQDAEISQTTIKNIYESLCNTNISEVYNSVIKFIKWHNKNKTNH